MEKLRPPLYLDEIAERIKSLKSIVSDLEKNDIQEFTEKIRVIKKNKNTQFYIIKKKNDTNGKYVLKSDAAEIKKILQCQYNSRLLKCAKGEISLLEKFYKRQKRGNTSSICRNYSLQRQELINTVTFGNTIYAKKWNSVPYKKKEFTDDEPVLVSSNGIRVRSKSEIIIADTLDRLKIPFRYEYPVKIAGKILHPDFYCLNLRTRQEFYWEHFGLMDNPEYVENTVGKLQLFQSAGFFPGKNLIISMEKQNRPLNSLMVEKLIKTYLM